MFEVKIAGYYKGKTPKRKRLRQSFSMILGKRKHIIIKQIQKQSKN